MKKAILDLTGCQNIFDLHQRIKTSLDFPDHYGKNWDAFWDCINRDCEAEYVTVIGTKSVSDNLKRDIEIMIELLEDNKLFWANATHWNFDYEIVD